VDHQKAPSAISISSPSTAIQLARWRRAIDCVMILPLAVAEVAHGRDDRARLEDVAARAVDAHAHRALRIAAGKRLGHVDRVHPRRRRSRRTGTARGSASLF
jgi:hypothetical protein